MNKQSLINKDRTWKTVLCFNPNHETVRFETNEIGDIKCPICESLMVCEIKTPLQGIKNDSQK